MLLDDMGEEMRVLYVACTRAREQLIMTGCLDHALDRNELALHHGLIGSGRGVYPFYLRSHAVSFYDWILPAVLDEEKEEHPVARLCIAGAAAVEEKGFSGREGRSDVWARAAGGSGENGIRKAVSGEMDFRYPYEEMMAVPQKVTVSELKRMEERFLREIGEDGSPSGDADHGKGSSAHIRELKPAFALGKAAPVTPAERGTIHHRLLQFLDFSEDWTREKLILKIGDLKDRGFFTGQEAAVIRPEKICAFLNSSLCARMAEADARGLLCREQPFVIGVDSREIDESLPAGEMVLVQGIIDAYFEEDGRIIIVDYKTDRVRRAEELIARYQKQLDWYARALTRLTGKEAGGRYLVSLELGSVIAVP